MTGHELELQDFERLVIRLKALMDENPAKALEESRAISPETSVAGVRLASLKASILVDAVQKHSRR